MDKKYEVGDRKAFLIDGWGYYGLSSYVGGEVMVILKDPNCKHVYRHNLPNGRGHRLQKGEIVVLECSHIREQGDSTMSYWVYPTATEK